MSKPAAETPELALRAFVRASGLFRNRMDPYFAQFGVSAAQWGVLRTLQRATQEGLAGLRLSELGHRLLVKPPSVTSIIDRLERTGLVTRAAAQGDQRAKLVALTAAGRQLLTRALQHHPAQVRTLMGGLTETEQRQLQRLMERLATHWESLGAAEPHAADDLHKLQEAR